MHRTQSRHENCDSLTHRGSTTSISLRLHTERKDHKMAQVAEQPQEFEVGVQDEDVHTGPYGISILQVSKAAKKMSLNIVATR
jgi:hypothetical protein